MRTRRLRLRILLMAPVLVCSIWLLIAAAGGTERCIPAIGIRPALLLSGDADPTYAGLAVYRRFDNLVSAIEARVPPGGRLELSVLRAGEEEELSSVTGQPDSGRLTMVVPLHVGEQPFPVGRYVVRGTVRSSSNCTVASADQPFFVVFNAFDARDEVFQAPPTVEDPIMAANLGGQVRILALDKIFTWELGTYTREVFTAAIAAVDGLSSALAAATALQELAHGRVDGYWPGLTDMEGRRSPSTPPEDDGWVNPWLQSVPGNLGGPDIRGQCYDFAAAHAAFLRSIGIPATVVSAIDPAPMPYPYALEWQTEWAFHAWTEFVAAGTWWAADPTYSVDASYAVPFQTGPKPDQRTGPWFAAVTGGDAVRIEGERGGEWANRTEEYRTPLRA